MGEPLQNNRGGAVQGTRKITSGNSVFNALGFLMETFAKNNINTSIIVKVTGVSDGYVDVVPLVAQTDAQGNTLPMAELPALPYYQYQGGKAGVVIKPFIGDIGLAVFAQQDCSNVQSGTTTTQPPGSFRFFDMSDGFYLGGFLNQKPETYLELTQGGKTNLISKNGIYVDGNTDINGNLNISGTLTYGGIGAGLSGAYVDEMVSALPENPQIGYSCFLTTDITVNKFVGLQDSRVNKLAATIEAKPYGWEETRVVDGAQIRNKVDDRLWTVKGKKVVPDIGEITYPVSAVPAFTPKYWSINGPISQSFSIVTSGDIATVNYTSRKYNDLCGLIWSSKDEHDHEGLAYESKANLNGIKFKFKLTISGAVPTLTSDLSPTMTLTSNDGTISYVRLANYALTQSAYEGIYEIDFATIKGGFFPTTPIDVSDIKTIMIGLISSSFNAESDAPLPSNLESVFVMQLLEPSNGHTMLALNKLTVPKHDIKMCTAYDDTFNISPERILYNTYMLGYRDFIDHYVGMSHYYQKIWNAAEYRFRIVEDGSLNIPCQKWHESYFQIAQSYGFKTIISLSFELYSESCPFEWTQRDWNDQYAQTGYETPSYILSPCIPEAMGYLHAVFLKFAKMQADNNMQVIVQVGEPWWWYNPPTNLPCIYDYPTRLAFFAETGQYAQDIGTIFNYRTGGVYEQYAEFVRNKLGEAVKGCGEAVKAVYPDAKVTILPFLPSILGSGLMEKINLPDAYYQSPNFDFYMTEGYDWLLDGKMLKLSDTVLLPEDRFGYPASAIHVLVGFVPDAAIAGIYGFEQGTPYRRELWKRIIGSIRNNLYYNVGYQYIWAYPQIMFDSLTIMPYSQYDYFFLGKAAYRAYVDERALDLITGGDAI